MSGHTPGPWTFKKALKPVDGEYDYAIGVHIDGKPHVLAETFGRTSPEHRPDALANAHLIAAAPELLAALYMMLEAYWGEGDGQKPEPHVIRTARAAIAKAERGTQ